MARLLIALLLVLPACSLMELDSVTLPRCQSDDDCLTLSPYEDLDPECRKYFCSDGACLRHRDGDESADGRDNDCDGVVDEPGVDANGAVRQTLAPETLVVVENVSAFVDVTYGYDDSGELLGAWAHPESGDAEAARIGLRGVVGKSMSYLRGVAEPGGVPADSVDLHRSDLEEGCYRLLEDGSVDGGSRCGFSELAVGLTSGPVVLSSQTVVKQAALVASVNTNGCAPGQLRVGFFELDADDPEVIMRGPLRRSNSYLGVDLTPGGSCTGGSRASCSPDDPSSDPSCGLARPAMAVMERPGFSPQALITWIGHHNGRGECGGDVAPVEMIGVFLETTLYDSGFGWVTATNEAVAQTLGRTAGGGPPAVAALEGLGYLVAYGDANGMLALHFVSAPPDPPAYDGYTCCDEDDDHEECEGTPICESAQDRSTLETRPIEGVVDFEPLAFDAGGAVDHVAISLGRVGDGRVELGLAWRGGCGTADEAVLFRRVVLSTESGVPVEVDVIGPAERLDRASSSRRVLGGPTIAYQPRGFVLQGFQRPGSPVASEDELGGWYVAWAARSAGEEVSRVFARRVLELDGRALDEQELIDVTQRDSSDDVDARAPYLYRSEGAIRFVYHDREGEVLVQGRLGDSVEEAVHEDE